MKIKYVKIENLFEIVRADKRSVYPIDVAKIYFSVIDSIILLKTFQGVVLWKKVGYDLYVLKQYADKWKIYYKNNQLRNSDEWCAATGTSVLDPDGWDRKNFKKSWGEKISLEEFSVRVSMSTASKEKD